MLNLFTLKHWLTRTGSNMKNIILTQAITHTCDDGKVLNLKAGANLVDDEVAEHWFVQHYIADVSVSTESDSKAVKQVESLEATVAQLQSDNKAASDQIEQLAESLKASETKVADLEKQLAESLKASAPAAPKAEK